MSTVGQPRALPTGVALVTLPALARLQRVGHFYATRHGGLSHPPYSGLNLGLHVGDDPAVVRANRRRLARATGLPLARFVFPNQVHGAEVSQVTAEMAGRGSHDAADALTGTDALITAVPGVCLTVLVADCVPLLLADPRRGVVGAAHAGWRGTALDVAGATVRAMIARLGSRPEHIVAAIGPSVGPVRYEVGPEVLASIRAAFPAEHPALLAPTRPGHARLDLWAANRVQLLRAGLRSENIHVAGLCTAGHTGDFYSVRAEGNPTGRFAGGVWLRGPAASTSRSSAPAP